jgi:hypothetical protein
MPKMNSTKSLSGQWLCGLASIMALAFSAQAQYDPNWLFHVRVGGLIGLNVKADFSRSGQFNVGSPTAGVYDDGYVRVDATGNAQGQTSFWGYQNGSQLDSTAHTLLMHQTTSYSTSGTGSGDDAPYFGGELAGGGNFWRSKSLRIGWEVGASILPVSIPDNENLPATASQNLLLFNTGTIVVPTAPYNGGSSGLGPTISGTPSTITSTSLPATITGTQTLDATVWAIRLGPTFFWDLNQYVGLQLGGGAAFGIVPGDLKFNETVQLPTGSLPNSGKISSTEFAFGGYVNAIVTFHVARNADLYLGGQYLPLQDVTFSGSGREARLKLGGQVGFMAGINWPF